VGNTASRQARASKQAVHPHERGEYDVLACLYAPACGSSPRTWGILRHQDRGIMMNRFIPTNVGNTTEGPNRGLSVQVHPHERGEYLRAVKKEIDNTGSSPRTWGILPPTFRPLHPDRFIPTNVGNTGA